MVVETLALNVENVDVSNVRFWVKVQCQNHLFDYP